MNDKEAVSKLRAVVRLKREALATERSYCGWLVRYCRFVRALTPEQQVLLESERKFELFLTHLARNCDVAVATQNQAFNAIIYFYKHALRLPLKEVDALRATRPQQQRHAPNRQDTTKLLNAVPNVGGYPCNLICRLLYGSGLRLGDAVGLRVKDVDVAESTLFIRGGKGGKDRVVRLPCAVTPELNGQLEYARTVWLRDCQTKVPIQLPNQLARKYPEYEFSLNWAWVFPQKHPCRDPRRPNRLVRWHVLPCNVQRAVKIARHITGVQCVPHELRHAYATHLLDRGVNMKALQEAMGHKYIETTSGYCHAEALSVRSPLDR